MITLVLAFHNHQPVGNFGWVFEQAFDRAYRPLMDELERWPSIRFAQHYTGILLDWFDEHQPGFSNQVRRLVDAGRVELLSGGYYEPILAMLPERDRLEQITRLNRRIHDAFGVEPEGMWLAERVWEPSLPSTLARAGLRYTFLDDTHFKHAGLDDEALTGYFLTEDQGHALAVFPIDKRLRYTMPFQPPEATLEYLHSLNRKGSDRVVAFADDGEKFGIWPDTYETVYEEGWLERFCELLDANTSWVRTVRPREVLASLPPAGRLYLPTASYAEMLHWALPTVGGYRAYEELEEVLKDQNLFDDYHRFVRGGFWRNFLVKYPEANAMQKKMLRASERLRGIRSRQTSQSAPEALESAARHLFAGQCNCPYWHGVFGGLYLSNIRAAIYRELIAAEADMDLAEGASAAVLTVVDYDLDGADEVIVETASQSVYLAPHRGGCIFELDHKGTRHNFLDLIQRRQEGYHALLAEHAAHTSPAEEPPEAGARSIHDSFKVKEEGLEKLLTYDTYRHASLVDHFPEPGVTAEDVRAGTAVDRGDFAIGAYELTLAEDATVPTVILRREGLVRGQGRIRIEKRISVDPVEPRIDVEYRLTPEDETTLDGPFGIEISVTATAGAEPDRYYLLDGRRPPEHGGMLAGAGQALGRSISVVDEWLGARVDVEFERDARILRAPVETVSLSEDGFERNYQGSTLLAIWDLGGESEWRMTLRQRIVPLTVND